MSALCLPGCNCSTYCVGARVRTHTGAAARSFFSHGHVKHTGQREQGRWKRNSGGQGSDSVRPSTVTATLTVHVAAAVNKKFRRTFARQCACGHPTDAPESVCTRCPPLIDLKAVESTPDVRASVTDVVSCLVKPFAGTEKADSSERGPQIKQHGAHSRIDTICTAGERSLQARRSQQQQQRPDVIRPRHGCDARRRAQGGERGGLRSAHAHPKRNGSPALLTLVQHVCGCTQRTHRRARTRAGVARPEAPRACPGRAAFTRVTHSAALS